MSVTTFLGIVALMIALELPDKTMIATVVMSTRAKPRNVALGASAGFIVQMGIAVAAGSLLTLLPHTLKGIIVGLLFLGGAAYLLLVNEKDEIAEGEREGSAEHPATTWREILTAFTVIFVGEFGDLTQIQAATLSGKYHQPLSVFLACSVAMVFVAVVGAYGGKALQRIVPLEKIRFVGGLIFLALGVVTLVQLRHW
jgi:putative Ca2+/H+ antiporter (TMEM165/GDT1 family)